MISFLPLIPVEFLLHFIRLSMIIHLSIAVHVETLEDMMIGAVEFKYLGAWSDNLPIFDSFNNSAITFLYKERR
jgi:hypothetical protein